ncbi:asparagine synthase B [Oleiagrimonas soli]|uniref:asparagine synthase (glutamine-hydrolyzing) n=1 Tax=Oleiagrimonas soli TaxID=1543381 RepID=A0A099CSX3_9GAMM|nr:asparagine synthase B [Oleiagrimonas soli]KGI76737.1 asparagine synthetase B [Oleiagrimonas soli]MBB6185028.1 asparagine synthase (glutamine-hydrolyzing) [Oleiagrimonas soli]
MCGFVAVLDPSGDVSALRPALLEQARSLRHRGPDWSGVYADTHAILAHERLAIVDLIHGAQPLLSSDGQQVLAVNGEIYNHRALRTEFPEYAFRTDSDCEVILPLYRAHGAGFVGRLQGMFAFVLWDRARSRWLIARDPIGIVPLYVGHDARGRLYVASEMKALSEVCVSVDVFPPGCVQTSDMEAPQRYYRPTWRDYEAVENGPSNAPALRAALERSVHGHMMSDVPYGVLLSGGLDSSLIAAITARYAARRTEDDDRSAAWWPRLHTFSIGLDGSPDLAAARTVAEAIDSVHHEFHFTVQEGLDALSDVIRHIETYDVTTIRASTPMYLLARRIRAMGIKMVLSGEGADELFGGYLYFHMAPNDREFHEELVRKLDALHQYDCLRANKAMAAWGVEARVPFLDRDFLDVAMQTAPSAKRPADGRIEKHILREAGRGLLPDSILWRQKEQFSDGVGYGWIDALKDYAAAQVSDAQMLLAPQRFAVNPPETKEAYYYRVLFEQHYPGDVAARTVPGGPSIACSTPTAYRWSQAFAGNADPSGRAIANVHHAAVDRASVREG